MINPVTLVLAFYVMILVLIVFTILTNKPRQTNRRWSMTKNNEVDNSEHRIVDDLFDI